MKKINFNYIFTISLLFFGCQNGGQYDFDKRGGEKMISDNLPSDNEEKREYKELDSLLFRNKPLGCVFCKNFIDWFYQGCCDFKNVHVLYCSPDGKFLVDFSIVLDVLNHLEDFLERERRLRSLQIFPFCNLETSRVINSLKEIEAEEVLIFFDKFFSEHKDLVATNYLVPFNVDSEGKSGKFFLATLPQEFCSNYSMVCLAYNNFIKAFTERQDCGFNERAFHVNRGLVKLCSEATVDNFPLTELAGKISFAFPRITR